MTVDFDLGVPLWQVLLVLLFAFIFGMLKSAFGLGGAAVTPLLAMMINPKFVVAVLGPLALWTDVAALRNHWGKWDLAIVKRGALPTILGTLAGVFILRGISPWLLNKVLAVITLSYVAVAWSKERRASQEAAAAAQGGGWLTSAPSAYFFTFAGGLVGTLSHGGGILITFYLLAMNLSKNVYIATLVSLFFIQNMLKVPLFVGMSILSVPGLLLTIAAIPLVFAGGWVGKKLNTRLTERQFSRFLTLLMLVVGTMLIFK